MTRRKLSSETFLTEVCRELQNLRFAQKAIHRRIECLLECTEIEWPEDGISPEAKDLIQRLLNPDPKHRLQAEGVKRHPFFADIDWDKIREQEAPFIPAPAETTDTSYFDREFLLQTISAFSNYLSIQSVMSVRISRGYHKNP